MVSSLPRKVVLITGASSGVGEATARAFARQSWSLALAARRYERLKSLAESLEADFQGLRALPLGLDVSNLEQVQACVQSSLDHFGRIDVLLNNAGLGRFDWLEKMDPLTDIKFQIEVNLLGMIWMAQSVLPHMQLRRGGHIINVASFAGFIAPPTYSIYAASKFAVRGFSEALRREALPWGIQVSTIYPGTVRTGFGRKTGARRKTRTETPGWLTLSSDQVANAVLRCVGKPRRSVVIPSLYAPFRWINSFLPWLSDWLMVRYFVERERAEELAA